jgi:hypothetical protein
MDMSPSNKQIAGHISAVFGGNPEVTRYADESGKRSIDIVCCPHAPQRGIDSYSTVGLSDHEQRVDGIEGSLCLELVGACRSGNEAFGSVLANAAFCSIISGWPVHPGAIFGDLVKHYDASTTLEHVMFVEPFAWNEELEPIQLSDKEVLWLMMIPISEAEAAYAETHGGEALEDLFEKNEIDVFDWERKSVV